MGRSVRDWQLQVFASDAQTWAAKKGAGNAKVRD